MEDLFKTLGDITNPNQNVKTAGQQNGEQKVPYIDGDQWSAITKREYFAGLAMQGILSNESFYERMSNEGGENKMVDKVSVASVKMADALLEALSKH
jgi:hypothetical protein